MDQQVKTRLLKSILNYSALTLDIFESYLVEKITESYEMLTYAEDYELKKLQGQIAGLRLALDLLQEAKNKSIRDTD